MYPFLKWQWQEIFVLGTMVIIFLQRFFTLYFLDFLVWTGFASVGLE